MVQASQVTQATRDQEASMIQGAMNPGHDLSREDLSSLGLVACCKREQLDLMLSYCFITS